MCTVQTTDIAKVIVVNINRNVRARHGRPTSSAFHSTQQWFRRSGGQGVGVSKRSTTRASAIYILSKHGKHTHKRAHTHPLYHMRSANILVIAVKVDLVREINGTFCEYVCRRNDSSATSHHHRHHHHHWDWDCGKWINYGCRRSTYSYELLCARCARGLWPLGVLNHTRCKKWKRWYGWMDAEKTPYVDCRCLRYSALYLTRKIVSSFPATAMPASGTRIGE